jgi:hypothetical protein
MPWVTRTKNGCGSISGASVVAEGSKNTIRSMSLE